MKKLIMLIFISTLLLSACSTAATADDCQRRQLIPAQTCPLITKAPCPSATSLPSVLLMLIGSDQAPPPNKPRS